MSWKARLQIDYQTRADGGTTALDRFEGPLRVLQRLYPEGPRVCHHVLVHPPGGIVGGDELEIALNLKAGSHALLTTAGATRFYRSAGPLAVQRLNARVEAGSRLEWLPLEAIAHTGTRAENRLRFELAPGAEMLGWDLLALGLPAAGQDFVQGEFLQHLELPGRWLERGRIRGGDALLESPLGLAGQRVLGCLWFAAGEPVSNAKREALLELARARCAAHTLAPLAGATAPERGLVVLRALAPRVEPLMDLFKSVWTQWRQEAWGLRGAAPRVWRT